MTLRRLLAPAVLLLAAALAPAADAPKPLVYAGGEGPGKGKHVVLVAGDEEYRSEEMLPQLALILSTRHGFKCTVLFSLNEKTGEIDPNASNIPGLEALDSADLMVLFLRFRHLPESQMKHIFDYVEAGKPVIGIRTATHAFDRGKGKYAAWDWSNAKGGFGRQVLGETWVNHHGGHGSQATRGILNAAMKDHPILKGIKDGDIFGPSDVYTVKLPLPGDCKPLVLGEVVAGMKRTDKPLAGEKNDPMMPIAWVKTYTPHTEKGKPARVFTSTMGCSQDFESEGYRRLLVNASYWCAGLEAKIPAKSDVAVVGKYKGSPFGNNRFRKGMKPGDYEIR
jgi:type 1 glutamine amidotransferase